MKAADKMRARMMNNRTWHADYCEWRPDCTCELGDRLSAIIRAARAECYCYECGTASDVPHVTTKRGDK